MSLRFTFFGALVLLVSSSAQAHYHHEAYQDCEDVADSYIVSRVIVQLKSACRIETPPTPSTSGQLDTWSGDYARQAIVRTTIANRDIYSCDWFTTSKTELLTIPFEMSNLNEEENLPESYASKPRMTQSEARSEFGVARQACLSVRPGDDVTVNLSTR